MYEDFAALTRRASLSLRGPLCAGGAFSSGGSCGGLRRRQNVGPRSFASSSTPHFAAAPRIMLLACGQAGGHSSSYMPYIGTLSPLRFWKYYVRTVHNSTRNRQAARTSSTRWSPSTRGLCCEGWGAGVLRLAITAPATVHRTASALRVCNADETRRGRVLQSHDSLAPDIRDPFGQPDTLMIHVPSMTCDGTVLSHVAVLSYVGDGGRAVAASTWMV